MELAALAPPDAGAEKAADHRRRPSGARGQKKPCVCLQMDSVNSED